MPHCILEYSANIADTPDWRQLFLKLHTRLAATGQFQLADIKSRAVCHEVHFSGDGAQDRAFITLNIQMLDGRSDEVKKEISALAAELVAGFFPLSMKNQKTSITVQICDIHRASYQRRVSY
jgi:5-carboxymethyl-2-hydroxymuconate isomerase